MTNLRSALEKAGVTPGNQAELAADNVVDELAKMIGHAPQNHHAPLEEDRPKLVEDDAEFASVVDRLEELVTGQPANDAPGATDEINATDFESVEDAKQIVSETTAEQMRAAATLTDDHTPIAPTANPDSIPTLQTDQISGNQPLAGGFSDEIRSIDDATVATNDESAAYDANGEPTAEFSSYDPLGIEDEISVGTNQFEPTTESSTDTAQDSESDAFDSLETFNSSTAEEPGENSADDFQAISKEESDDTANPVEPQSTVEHPPQFPEPEAVAANPDTEGFYPQMIPGVKPGNTMSMVTTDESQVDDPVAAANELTGDFLPQDLNEPHYDEFPQDDSDQIEFVETNTDAFDKSSVANAAVATAPGAALVPTESKPSFLQTTNLQTTPEQYEAEQQQEEPAKTAPVVAFAESTPAAELTTAATSQPEVTTSPTTPEPTPAVTPISTSEATASDRTTQFEQHVLENLTNSPYTEEYQQLAESVLTPDLNAQPKTICFLSAEDGSHSAQIISHLAVVFSTLQNKKVLLVDANGCPDNITRSFQKDKQPGLKNMNTVNDDWLDMALPTAVPNLFILPAGWRRGGATHWEAGEYAGLIPLFTRQFDLTLIDGGVAERTEDTPFYAACDRTLMLVRLGQTDRTMATAVRNGLKNANVQLDGCIITNHST